MHGRATRASRNIKFALILVLLALSTVEPSRRRPKTFKDVLVKHLKYKLRRANVNRLIFIKTHKTAGQSAKIDGQQRVTIRKKKKDMAHVHESVQQYICT